MEQLTTIWKYDTDLNKWLRVKDVTISLSDDKLKELQKDNPNEEYKISDKRPKRGKKHD